MQAMGVIRYFQFLLLGATLLAGACIVQVFRKQVSPTANLLAQNTYLGPTGTGSDHSQFIRVEVIVQDSPQLGGVRIQQASFDGHDIPMKTPPDIYGHRGVASFQVLPGDYKLLWTVKRDAYVWPRTVDHEEIVHVNPRDLWVQVTIEGDSASIR